ncbi:MAG: HAMP domain-containing sensor histidine kinase [Bacteroidota bacterium]
MTSPLRTLHVKLVGDSNHFSLQARIFHEVSIIGIIAISAILIINIFIKVPHVNILLGATLLILVALFYNSRYLGNLKTSVIIFTLSTNILLLANYFYNSGIQGPTVMLFMLSLIFTVSVMSIRQFLFWASLNSFFITSLLAIEYYNPELVKNSYADRSGYFIDMLTSYLAAIVCIVVVLRYLIESQQSEKMKAILASKALGEANDSKTKLLSILSHDLRVPLNSIQSFLEMLIEYDLDEHEKKAIKTSLLNETKNTQTMLFNLLSWTKSQMDSGVKVNLVPVNILNLVKTCIAIQNSAATEKKINIENQVEAEIYVSADQDMLNLVVRNLLNNSIKFTNPGGNIVVSAEIVNKNAIICISDTGIGISETKMKEVFSMKSVSTYGTNNEKGVGLGLLLCKEFTELQHGQISVESSADKGTFFYLTFPLYNNLL